MRHERSLWRKAGEWAGRATVRKTLAAPLLYLALGAARAAVLILPFRAYAPIFGEPCAAGHSKPDAPSLSPEAHHEGARARRIGRTVEVIASTTPWKSNCLAQALVVAGCLRVLKIGFTVHFGVAQPEDTATPIEAHSWVMAGAFPVTGYRESLNMTCVHSFRYTSA